MKNPHTQTMTGISNISELEAAKEAAKPKKKSGKYLKTVDLAKMAKRARNILDRDLIHLQNLVSTDKLNRQASSNLCAYIKLLEELEEVDKKKLESFTDEELAKIAANAPSRTSTGSKD